MDRKIIPVSVNDQDIIEYLESKENKSKYIRDLIKKDMESYGVDPQIKKYIEELIRQNLGSAQVSKPDDLTLYASEINDIFEM